MEVTVLMNGMRDGNELPWLGPCDTAIPADAVLRRYLAVRQQWQAPNAYAAGAIPVASIPNRTICIHGATGGFVALQTVDTADTGLRRRRLGDSASTQSP